MGRAHNLTGGGGRAIQGELREYPVAPGETISAGDFVKVSDKLTVVNIESEIYGSPYQMVACNAAGAVGDKVIRYKYYPGWDSFGIAAINEDNTFTKVFSSEISANSFSGNNIRMAQVNASTFMIANSQRVTYVTSAPNNLSSAPARTSQYSGMPSSHGGGLALEALGRNNAGVLLHSPSSSVPAGVAIVAFDGFYINIGGSTVIYSESRILRSCDLVRLRGSTFLAAMNFGYDAAALFTVNENNTVTVLSRAIITSFANTISNQRGSIVRAIRISDTRAAAIIKGGRGLWANLDDSDSYRADTIAMLDTTGDVIRVLDKVSLGVEGNSALVATDERTIYALSGTRGINRGAETTLTSLSRFRYVLTKLKIVGERLYIDYQHELGVISEDFPELPDNSASYDIFSLIRLDSGKLYGRAGFRSKSNRAYSHEILIDISPVVTKAPDRAGGVITAIAKTSGADGTTIRVVEQPA